MGHTSENHSFTHAFIQKSPSKLFDGIFLTYYGPATLTSHPDPETGEPEVPATWCHGCPGWTQGWKPGSLGLHQLHDHRQQASPLWAPVFSSTEWEQETIPATLPPELLGSKRSPLGSPSSFLKCSALYEIEQLKGREKGPGLGNKAAPFSSPREPQFTLLS